MLVAGDGAARFCELFEGVVALFAAGRGRAAPMIFRSPRRVRVICVIRSCQEPAMTQASFATHEVFNQSPPFEDVDLFALDRPLVEAVAANGGASARSRTVGVRPALGLGRRWRSAAALANENTPKLHTFDARGNRRDEVEFHPAYHELMAHSAHAGMHNSTWDARRASRPAARPKWCARRNSTWRRRSRPGICARSP